MSKSLVQRLRAWGIRFRNHSPAVYWRRWFTAPRILDAPPFALASDAPLEMHLLVSEREFLGGLWSLWSFFHHSSRPVRLAVHDDGTLGASHRRALEKLFPGARFISRREADAAVEPTLAGRPNCLALRRRSPLGMKVFDFFQLAEAEGIVLADSDIVFFADPLPFTDPEGGNVFLEDIWTNYVLPLDELPRRFGVEVPPRINIGLGRVARDCYDPDFVERVLSDPQVRDAPFLFAQTLVALMVARQGARTVGDEFRMTNRKGVDGLALKHYTRTVRHLLYTEGIPYIRRRFLAHAAAEARAASSRRPEGAETP